MATFSVKMEEGKVDITFFGLEILSSTKAVEAKVTEIMDTASRLYAQSLNLPISTEKEEEKVPISIDEAKQAIQSDISDTEDRIRIEIHNFTHIGTHSGKIYYTETSAKDVNELVDIYRKADTEINQRTQHRLYLRFPPRFDAPTALKLLALTLYRLGYKVEVTNEYPAGGGHSTPVDFIGELYNDTSNE